MSTIHFIGGEKGGVGKSVVARLLAQHFIDRELAFTALDADGSHGALLRYYADYAKPVDLAAYESADRIVELALAADQRVLVDLPAQAWRPLVRWIAASDVLALANEMAISLVFWHVTDGGFDSVNLLDPVIAQAAGPRCSCVVVRNFGRSADFSQFDESPEREHLLAGGGHIVDLAQLDATTMYKIDRHGSSLWAAINSSEGERALGLMERRRAKAWFERCNESLAPLTTIL